MSDKNMYENLLIKEEIGKQKNTEEADKQLIRNQMLDLRSLNKDEEIARNQAFFSQNRSANKKTLRNLIKDSTYMVFERNIEEEKSLNFNLEEFNTNLLKDKTYTKDQIKENDVLMSKRTELSQEVSKASDHRFAKTRKSRLKTSAKAMANVNRMSRNLLKNLKSEEGSEEAGGMSRIKQFESIYSEKRVADRNMAEAMARNKKQEKLLKDKADKAYYTRLINLYVEYLAQQQDSDNTKEKNKYTLSEVEKNAIRTKMDETASKLATFQKTKEQSPNDVIGNEISSENFSQGAMAYYKISKIKNIINQNKLITREEYINLVGENENYYDGIYKPEKKGALAAFQTFAELKAELEKHVLSTESEEQRKRYADAPATPEEVEELETIRENLTKKSKGTKSYKNLSVRSLRFKKKVDGRFDYYCKYFPENGDYDRAFEKNFVKSSKIESSFGFDRTLRVGLKHVEMDENGEISPAYIEAHKWNIRYMDCMTKKDEKSLEIRKEMLTEQLEDFIYIFDNREKYFDPDRMFTNFDDYNRANRLYLGIREIIYGDGTTEKIYEEQIDENLKKRTNKIMDDYVSFFGSVLKEMGVKIGVEPDIREYLSDVAVKNLGTSLGYARVMLDEAIKKNHEGETGN